MKIAQLLPMAAVASPEISSGVNLAQLESSAPAAKQKPY